MKRQSAEGRGQRARADSFWLSALALSPKPSLLLCLALLLSGVALAHATIVFGTLSSHPEIPQPGQPFTLAMSMVDPSQVPVEDALVRLEVRRTKEPDPLEAALVEILLEETVPPGTYQATLALPEAGDYHLLLRDQTFRQEEAQAELTLTLGDGPLFAPGANTVVFPPTAMGLANLGIWLIWIIAVPLLAGLVVTVLVLTSTNKRGEDEGDAQRAER